MKPVLLLGLSYFLVPLISCSQQSHNNLTSQNGIFQQRLSNLHHLSSQVPAIMAADPSLDAFQTDTLSSKLLKTYVRSNDMRAYHLDLHSYRPEAKYSGDPSFVDSRNPEHQERCAKHLNSYKQLLESFYQLDPVLERNSLNSIRLTDTFGRPESGLLGGNQFWLGDYDNCLEFQYNHLNLDQKQHQLEPIKSQYCLGVAHFPDWNPQATKTSIKVGLCLPETCSSSIINENSSIFETVETMMKYQFGSSKPFSDLKLKEVYCLPHPTSEIRQYSQSAIYFLLFVGSLVALSFIATTVEYVNSKLPETLKQQQIKQIDRNWRQIVIESFSIPRNLIKLLTIREDSKESIPSGLNESDSFKRDIFLNSTTGLKCIGLFWVISAHTFLVGPISSSNIMHSDKLTKTYLADIYLTAHLIVDTFFALSGLLASYFLFKNGLDKIRFKEWILLTIHRYWRLTSIYLICYWFSKSLGQLAGSGPLWDYMTAEQSPRLNCVREPWSEAILHMSDFKSPKEHCIPFAWFIANGIKFWIVTPIFLILIHKSIRRGYLITLGTIVANIVLVGTLAMKSNVDMKSVIEFKPESADNMLNNMGQVYTRPYSRIGAYLIGLLAGHLIYLVDTKQLEVKLSKNVNTIIWTLVSITVIALTFVLKIANRIELEEAAIPWVFSISSALIRPLWAICTCWFVFALAHGQAQWAAKFLSAKCWRLLVKLSFCAYLAQGEVLAQLIMSKSSSDHFAYVDMVSRPIVAIVMTIVVSSLMVVLLEYPLNGIEELLLPKRHVKPSATTNQKIPNDKLKPHHSDKLKSN